MSQKKNLGQFYTTKADYILSGFESLVKRKNVTDPFAGSGDLLSWADKNKAKKTTGYDIDAKNVNGNVYFNDSIKNTTKGSFVLTNPPYLGKNKATKEIKEAYFKGNKFEDLYQASINAIVNNYDEGILIVPLNFLSAENSQGIRDTFFRTYKITKAKIFTEQVFDDTTITVVAFHFSKHKVKTVERLSFELVFVPENKSVEITIESKFSWSIGGKELSAIKNTENILGITRLQEAVIKQGKSKIDCYFNDFETKKTFLVDPKWNKEKLMGNIILIKAIDSDKNMTTPLGFYDIRKEYGVEKLNLVGKETSRHLTQVVFDKKLSIKEQERLIEIANKELSFLRNKFNGLFLTNFRDGNRKRMGFDLAYSLLNHAYAKMTG